MNQTLEEVSARKVALDLIDANPENCRTDFNEEKLQELADSLKSKGQLQSIVVRPKGDGRFEIVVGERRYRAAKMIGWTEISATVRECSDEESLIFGLEENCVRDDISPIERARATSKLWMKLGCRQKELAKRLDMSPSALSNQIRLLDLPEKVQDLIHTNELSESAGKALLTWKDYPELLEHKLKKAQDGTPTKDLEKLTTADSSCFNAIDKDWCEKDPECKICHHVRKAKSTWVGDRERRVCLNSECFKRKDQIAKDAKTTALREKLGIGPDDPLPLMNDMDYRTYDSFDYGIPTGCLLDKCEFYKPAVTWNDKIKKICMKPGCARSLKGKGTREKNKQADAKRQEALDKAIDLLQNPDSGERMKMAAALAVLPIFQETGMPMIQSALKCFPDWDCDREAIASKNHKRVFEALGDLGMVNCIRLAAALRAKLEAHKAAIEKHDKTPYMDLFNAETTNLFVIRSLSSLVREGDLIVRKGFKPEEKEKSGDFDKRLSESALKISLVNTDGAFVQAGMDSIGFSDLDENFRFFPSREMVEPGDKVVAVGPAGDSNDRRVETITKLNPQEVRFESGSHPSWGIFQRNYTIVFRANNGGNQQNGKCN